MKCRCWLPYRHDADCERARAEARERARERAASDRLLRDAMAPNRLSAAVAVSPPPAVESWPLTNETVEPMGSWEPRS